MSGAVEFDWVDAFSSVPFRGNGCAVVYHAEDWDEAKRLAYVRETSLSECTFVEREGEHWRVRYYLANQEIPYAGHPTIATAWSLYERGLIDENAILKAGIGDVPVAVRDGSVTINAPIAEIGARYTPDEIAEIYDISPDYIVGNPVLAQAGLGFVITHLRDQDALDQAKLDAEKLFEFQKRHGLPNNIEPYLVTFDHEFTDQALSLGRLLLPPPHPSEDPFTGSATGIMACWAYQNALAPAEFTHAQGHNLGRLGFATIRIENEQGCVKAIHLKGEAHTVMQGTIKAEI